MRRSFSILLALFALAGCATLRVGSDFDPAASFTGYHSFAFMPREHYGTRNPLVVRRAHDAIEAELTARGFAPAADGAGADFIVDFTIGAQERIDVNSYPAAYRGPWHWGWPYFGEEVSVRKYREGTLAIDVFDARTHQPVWHGWAKKELTQKDLDQPAGRIREAVTAVLAKFPPK